MITETCWQRQGTEVVRRLQLRVRRSGFRLSVPVLSVDRCAKQRPIHRLRRLHGSVWCIQRNSPL